MNVKMEALLQRGIPRERITYYYQPIYDVGRGRITKAELLLRVSDGKGGFFPTEKLVSIAERMGKIDEMDKAAFYHACTVQREFARRGVELLEVNLSPAACQNLRLVSEVERILAETGADPQGLCIEITELYKIVKEDRFCASVRRLHELGLHIAVDDFGTGYSSLQRLLKFPFQILKLDKSLIWAMDGQNLAASMVDHVIQFSTETQHMVVAEGVETPEQARQLSEMGCTYLQGYYFGRPMSQEDFLALCENWDERPAERLMAAAGTR